MLFPGLRPEKVALRGSCSEPLRWSIGYGYAPKAMQDQQA